MIKCFVYIYNETEYMHKDVRVEIFLPAIPQKGDMLYLTEELYQELEQKAKKDLKIATLYAPKWFYGDSYTCTHIKKKNLKELSFDDAHVVTSILYEANSNYVKIELNDEIN